MQFYLFEEEYKYAIGPLVTQLVQRDKGEEVTDYLTPNQLWRATNKMDINEHQNHAPQYRSLYTKFSEHLLTEGNIKWRLHERGTEICMMNDVDRDTGVMKPNSFVHVTYTTDENGEILFTCTCKVFDFICQTAHQQNPIWPLEDTIPDTSFTSLHCRFFKDYLINVCTKVQSKRMEALPPALSMVKRSFHFINEPYVLMGNVHLTFTTKFSVKGFEDNTYSSVHLTFEYFNIILMWNVEFSFIDKI